MGAEGKRAIIFGSMSCGDGAFLRPYLEDGEWVVICADGGIRSARDAGLRPDYQIGDWDSGGAPEPGRKMPPAGLGRGRKTDLRRRRGAGAAGRCGW